MQKFTKLTAVAAPMDASNIDTDQIIPKQFLLAVDRKGFGKHLFHNWRYLDEAETMPNPDFGLLLVRLSEEEIEEIMQALNDQPGMEISVNLEDCAVTVGAKHYSFTLDPFRRHCILEGLDAISLTLEHEEAIAQYEARRPTWMKKGILS